MLAPDTHLTMTSDDLRAARVLTLAVKFFGTTRPLPSSSIRADLYPDLDGDSFNRQYLRDRELLATLGIMVCEAGASGTDTLWEVDEGSSYVTGEGLGAADARMLYVLCHDLIYDQAFPYRDELRMALAKISRVYRGTTVAHHDAMSAGEHRLLRALVSCMSARHAAAVTYVDAQGGTSARTMAILGSFGMRGRTYFVASRVERDGTLVPDSVRTYRLDRFQKVRELRHVRYQIPLDFSVSDYERLPFQMGDACDTARLFVGGGAGRDVARAMATHGTIAHVGTEAVWEVAYSDVRSVAAWAVGSGICPLGPPEVVEAWKEVLSRTVDASLLDRTLSSGGGRLTPASARGKAGRTGSTLVARQLIALASSLTQEGEVITAHEIAQTLGVEHDQARHLIALVSLGSGESMDYLPLVLGDRDEEVSLMEGAMMSARRVRLTRSETIALSAALGELGIDGDDPLAATLSAAYGSPGFSARDVMRSLASPSSPSDGEALKLCSRAISNGDALRFVYHPVTGDAASSRSVIPHLVRRGDDSWYLEGFDVMRGAERVFRIDRMSEITRTRADDAPMPAAPREPERLVGARFSDPRYLDLFHWDGLQTLSSDDSGVTARLPLYGGPWLARHLAACAGTVRVDDADVARQAWQYAHDLLEQADGGGRRRLE